MRCSARKQKLRSTEKLPRSNQENETFFNFLILVVALFIIFSTPSSANINISLLYIEIQFESLENTGKISSVTKDTAHAISFL